MPLQNAACSVHVKVPLQEICDMHQAPRRNPLKDSSEVGVRDVLACAATVCA